ncbi:MAG: hypothetical protein KKB13_05080 [Chloroflexi bacterium]|nr:hypothetical protein [Chloroflexota bacterium]
MKRIDTFIPADDPAHETRLGRWLPPLPPQLVTEYLDAYSSPGDVIWDPFCRGGDVALPAVRQDRRVLISDYNPLTNFLARMAVNPTPARDVHVAYTSLSTSVRHSASLRDHLSQLYATQCSHCHESVVADYLIWQRQDDRLLKKHYECPHCQREYLEPATDADRQRAAAIEPKGFHYWYILERLAPANKRAQATVERLLGLYTSRNLYALVTLLMRIESVVENKAAQDALKEALLYCLLEGSKLAGRRGGNNLRVPAQFRENNVWLCFDDAVARARSAVEARPPARLTDDLPAILARDETLWDYGASARRPDVLIARRTPRQMVQHFPPASIDLILTRPPYPDRAFLSLAYLWTGWLMGAGPAAVLSRLLYQSPFEGWTLVLPALRKTFAAMFQALKPNHALVLLFNTADADYVTSLVMTAVAAGFDLDTLLFQRRAATPQRKPDGEYRLTFLRPAEDKPPSSWQIALTPSHLTTTLQAAAVRAARQGLQERGEPMSDDWLQTAILLQLGDAQEHVLGDLFALADSQAERRIEFDALGFLNEQITLGLRQAVARGVLLTMRNDAVTDASEPIHDLLADAAESPDGDEDKEDAPVPAERLWWLGEPTYKPLPLSERVEQTVYNVLSTSQSTTEAAVSRVVASLYRGLLTPAPNWVPDCLTSYGRCETNGTWSLRLDDDRRLRVREHTELLALLTDLGHRLGFGVWIGRREQKRKLEGGGTLQALLSARERYIAPEALVGGGRHAADVDVLWYDAGCVYCAFEVEWMAQLTTPVLVRGADRYSSRSYIVLPAARVDLVKQRIQEAPLLRQVLANGAWEFIKYERLRAWAAQPEVELDELAPIAGLDPVIESGGVQLALF